MIDKQHEEYLEAVRQEVQPVLWAAADVTGNRRLERVAVSERSTVANLIWNDRDGTQLRRLSDRLGVEVEYHDTLIHVARRFRASSLAKQ